MKTLSLLSLFVLVSCASVAPASSKGSWFTTRFAEHPSMIGPKVWVVISNGEITVESKEKNDIFEVGVIASGELTQHSPSGKWIIAQNPSDKFAAEVGGCSDGPNEVDIDKQIFWTC